MSQLLVQQADIKRAVNQPHFQSSSQSDDKLTINDLVEMGKKGFTPVLSSSDVIECEKNFHQAGQYRRICLSLLSKSSQDLIQNLAKHPDLIDSGIKETVDILKKEGICTARELINGVWEEVSLY